VRRLASRLPGVEETTAWGKPALKLHGRLVACMASHKSAEPGTLVAVVGFDQRDAMIADDPDTYYLQPHYAGHPSVLVRLARVNRGALGDLLQSACRYVEGTARKATRRAPRTR
jgi:hypothetical protein